MKILKSRAFAALILLIVMALSTAFSVHRTLGAACQQVTAGFYDGVYDKNWGATRPSIASKLSAREDASMGLITIAENYAAAASETESLKNARYALIDAESIPDKYKANHDLGKAFEALYEALGDCPLTSRELIAASDYEYRFTGAQSVIETALYNDSVREFERTTLNVFPTNMLKAVVASEIPEKFE